MKYSLTKGDLFFAKSEYKDWTYDDRKDSAVPIIVEICDDWQGSKDEALCAAVRCKFHNHKMIDINSYRLYEVKWLLNLEEDFKYISVVQFVKLDSNTSAEYLLI